MADFALDGSTGLEADAAVKAASTPTTKQQAFWNVVRDRFANGSRLRLVNESGVTVTISLQQGSIVGDALVFPAFQGTANATAPCDIDVGAWRGFIDNGDRFISSQTVPPVGRSAPAAIRVTGGNIGPGIPEFAAGSGPIGVGQIRIGLPPLSHFAVAAPPPPGGVCAMSITAPDEIPIDQTLNYTLTMANGSCGAWQTWLIGELSNGGPAGEGAIIGQTDSVGGAGGAYMKDLRNLSPGTYKLWGRCNDTASCSGAWATRPIVLLPSSNPGGGTTGDASWPTESQFTTANAQGVGGSWEIDSNGDWRSCRRAGAYLGNNNCWNDTGLQFVPNWNALISGTQYQQRVGIGTPGSDGRVNVRMQVRLPSEAVVKANHNRGAGEVVTYPELMAGRVLGIGHYQQNGIPNVPIRFGDIQSFRLGADRWIFSGQGHGWIAHDMRASNSSAQHSTPAATVAAIDAEILVTRMHFPSSHNVDDGSTSGRMVWSGSLGGVFYKVFFQLGATEWPIGRFLVQFRAVSGMPNHVDFKPVIDWCLTRRYSEFGWTGKRARGQGYNDTIINPGMWWHQVITGMETEYGDYNLDIENFYCRVNEPYPPWL